jgi:hypothetical protein
MGRWVRSPRQLTIGIGTFVFETARELSDSPRLPLRQGPIDLTGCFAEVTAGVCLYDAGINGKALAPASMQARTTASKTWRKRSLPRKRPWPLTENVE